MGFPNSREDRCQEEQPCDTAPMETRAEPTWTHLSHRSAATSALEDN